MFWFLSSETGHSMVAGRMFVPRSISLDVSLAMFRWSPVIIFTATLACRMRCTVRAVSVRGGSSMGTMPAKVMGPPFVETATAMVLYPRRESATSASLMRPLISLSLSHFHWIPPSSSSSPSVLVTPYRVSSTLLRRPLPIIMSLPRNFTFATVRLTMGLKPAKCSTVYSPRTLLAWVTKWFSKDAMTAWSMGSSLLFGFEAMAAQVSTSSFEKPESGMVQILSKMIFMFAVVRVPVLSEQRTFMLAISWRAVRCVTMAFFSAMVLAPMAMVT
mmetsp:Transcript_1424/g.4366  ORF Transcript_1424/g.4366 Transcript_1424/m.4366 type:complete len:273 (+) Transcript_1424:1702-2520(+)